MTMLMIGLRVIHIACGVFWAGAIVFVVVFLTPSVREVGPDGGKVMAALQRRGFMSVMPVVAFITIGSGLWMLHIVSAGFNGAWMMSPIGHTYLTGLVASIAAVTIGLVGLRRNVLAAGRLAGAMASADDSARPAMQQEIGQRQESARKSGVIVAVLLVLAVITMAVARYVPALGA